MKTKLIALVAAMAVLVSMSSIADEQLEQVRDALKSVLPDSMQLNSLFDTQISDVYEASIGNSVYFVVLRDNHLIIGDAIDLNTGSSLSDEKSHQAISAVVEDTAVEDMIVFAAKGKAKRHLTVFTDIDCGYCRRFHREVPTLNEAGLEVRYMAFPRAGIDSSSYDKIVSVWCTDDQQKAMTEAKSGVNLPFTTCQNPVADHYQAGVQAGIEGTPTLVLDDGTLIGGYVPADNLLGRMGLTSN